MLRIRLVVLAGVLVVAGIVNVFFAPQIYTPRPPVFTGADMAASREWRGHAFSFQPSWLAKNLPASTFTHVKTGRPPGFPPDGGDIGLMWNERTVILEGLSIDETRFPLDISGLGVRDTLVDYHQLFAQIRCQSDPRMEGPEMCDYFVAWDEGQSPEDALTFVAVFTVSDQDEQEVGFVEQDLLTRLVGGPLERIPTIGDEQQ